MKYDLHKKAKVNREWVEGGWRVEGRCWSGMAQGRSGVGGGWGEDGNGGRGEVEGRVGGGWGWREGGARMNRALF